MTINDPNVYTKPWTSQTKKVPLYNERSGQQLSTDGTDCLKTFARRPMKWINLTRGSGIPRAGLFTKGFSRR